MERRFEPEEQNATAFDAALRSLDLPGPTAGLRSRCLPPAEGTERRPYRVLVVDDEPNLRRLVEIHLTRAGYEVETATNGAEALESLRRRRPDLLVLDVMMPGLNGFEVLAEIKSEPETAEILVVMLTAQGTDDHIRHGWGTGADFYMVKPFNPEELRMVVDRLTAALASPDSPPPLRRWSK